MKTRFKVIKTERIGKAKAQECSERRGGASLLPCCFASLSLCVLLAGCVPMPEDALKELTPPAEANEPPYTGLAPGAKSYETAHFLVKANRTDVAVAYSVVCEQSYGRIMSDLGLYSFAPAKPYNIVVYRDAEEFLSKTGQPRWSGGMAYGNAILVYESEGAAAILAHEMTHLIFNEFMGLNNSADFKWINEGMAVYEESRASASSRAAYNRRLVRFVKSSPIPFSQLVNLAPPGFSKDVPGHGIGDGSSPDNTAVERWYAQAGSVASFLINEGGTLGFSAFISRLKAGDTPDAAIGAAFPGLWRNLSEVERAWLLYIRG